MADKPIVQEVAVYLGEMVQISGEQDVHLILSAAEFDAVADIVQLAKKYGCDTTDLAGPHAANWL